MPGQEVRPPASPVRRLHLRCSRATRRAVVAMDKSAVAKMGAMASASVCALVGGVVLAQYIFTMKKKTGRKTKIIEMVGARALAGRGWRGGVAQRQRSRC